MDYLAAWRAMLHGCLMRVRPMMLETYMRPSAGLALTAMQLLPPVPAGTGLRAHSSLMLNREEMQVPGKTGEFNSSVVLVWQLLRLLFPCRERWRSFLREGELVFPFAAPQLDEVFSQTPADLPLIHSGTTPYCLRHGGASEDRNAQSRCLEEVLKRGYLRSRDSVRT